MQAVILAAGLGKRIQSITNCIPKCLIEVNGKRIINYQLDTLNNLGIQDIVVVVGYLQEKIRTIIGNRVIYIENAIYGKSNSSYSLWLARNILLGDFIYLNGDLLFHESILKRLLDDPAENVMATDHSKIEQEDDMFKARIEAGQIIELTKRMDPKKTSAVAPGPVKFSKRGRNVLFSALEKIVHRGDKSQWCYSIFSRIAAEIQLKSLDISDLPWIEIDTVEDLERAKRMIFI